MIRQLLTESLVLLITGLAIGIVVARWTFTFLEQLVPPSMSLFAQPTLDGRTLALAAAVEFEHDVPGRLRSDVLHPVRLSSGIEDHAVPADTLSERFQRALEDDDADVVCVDVRRIAGTWRERADMKSCCAAHWAPHAIG